jgi:hypothetical protein
MEIKKKKINEKHANQQKTNGTNERPMEIKKMKVKTLEYLLILD